MDNLCRPEERHSDRICNEGVDNICVIWIAREKNFLLWRWRNGRGGTECGECRREVKVRPLVERSVQESEIEKDVQARAAFLQI